MPQQNSRDNAASIRPSPRTSHQAVPTPQPHNVPWFWRLMGLFGRQSHPVNMDKYGGADDAESLVANWWQEQFRIGSSRVERYRIFDDMDSFGLVSAILDVYAEEVTQPDYDKGRSVWIESANQKLVSAGEECLRNCQMEDRLMSLTRRIAKYGDEFRRLIYKTGQGVVGWKTTPVRTMHRVEDKYSRLIGFRQDGQKYRGEKGRAVSWPWDYVHFRLLGKDDAEGYGTALLEAMFRPWRQLALVEDSILLYRLRRAPDRNIIFVDVGNMADHEAMEYVNAWRKRFRKHEFIDPASPQYRKQYNPLTPIEDVFMPQRGDVNNNRVEQLTGSGNVGEVYDLEYYRDKFFGSAKVPKAYFGFEGDINAKATLLQQDVRFARSCKRLRKSAIYGLRQLLEIHYTLLPTNPEDTAHDFRTSDGKMDKFLVQMSPIAYLDEFERLELVQLRFQVVDAMANLAQTLQIDPKVWALYILQHYAKLPEEVVQKLVVKTQPSGAEGESLTQKERQQILETHGPAVLNQIMEPMGREGYYSLSRKEEQMIAEAIHQSPKLRKVIGDIAEYCIEDQEAFQTDPSVLPPTVQGNVLEDTFVNDPAAKELKEDMEALKPEKKEDGTKGK